jgi:hypothetical protein
LCETLRQREVLVCGCGTHLHDEVRQQLRAHRQCRPLLARVRIQPCVGRQQRQSNGEEEEGQRLEHQRQQTAAARPAGLARQDALALHGGLGRVLRRGGAHQQQQEEGGQVQRDDQRLCQREEHGGEGQAKQLRQRHQRHPVPVAAAAQAQVAEVRGQAARYAAAQRRQARLDVGEHVVERSAGEEGRLSRLTRRGEGDDGGAGGGGGGRGAGRQTLIVDRAQPAEQRVARDRCQRRELKVSGGEVVRQREAR